MHLAKMAQSPSLKYLKATLLTALAVSLLPLTFLWVAYNDYQSPQWDTSGDSGVAQGIIFIGAAAALALVFASLAFPAAAKLLHRRSQFSRPRFVRVLSVWLATLSFLLAFAIAGILGSLSGAFAMGVVIFGISGFMVLPFTLLWFRLSQ